MRAVLVFLLCAAACVFAHVDVDNTAVVSSDPLSESVPELELMDESPEEDAQEIELATQDTESDEDEDEAENQDALSDEDESETEDEDEDEDEKKKKVYRKKSYKKRKSNRRRKLSRCSKKRWAKKWRRCGRRRSCRRRWSRRRWGRVCRRRRSRRSRRSRRVRRRRAPRRRSNRCARSCARSCRLNCPFGAYGYACRGHCGMSCRKIRCQRYLRFPNPNYYKYANSQFHTHPLGWGPNIPGVATNGVTPFSPAGPFGTPSTFPFAGPAALGLVHPAAFTPFAAGY